MSLLHSRCISIETSLLSRVSDLEAEVDRLRQSQIDLIEKAAERERALVDRLIAMTNPLAARAILSSAPAEKPPVMSRSGGLTSTPPRPTNLPGNRQRPMENRSGVGPTLTPKTSGFRPGTASATATAAAIDPDAPPAATES